MPAGRAAWTRAGRVAPARPPDRSRDSAHDLVRFTQGSEVPSPDDVAVVPVARPGDSADGHGRRAGHHAPPPPVQPPWPRRRSRRRAVGVADPLGRGRRRRHRPAGVVPRQAVQRRLALREPLRRRGRDARVRARPAARPDAALRDTLLRPVTGRDPSAGAAHEHRVARRDAVRADAGPRNRTALARHRAHDAHRHATEGPAHPPQRVEVRGRRRRRRARHRAGRRGLDRLRLGRWVRREGHVDPRPAARVHLRASQRGHHRRPEIRAADAPDGRRTPTRPTARQSGAELRGLRRRRRPRPAVRRVPRRVHVLRERRHAHGARRMPPDARCRPPMAPGSAWTSR